jgi:hypothetical protein
MATRRKRKNRNVPLGKAAEPDPGKGGGADPGKGGTTDPGKGAKLSSSK